jgi:hypothetical protein
MTTEAQKPLMPNQEKKPNGKKKKKTLMWNNK